MKTIIGVALAGVVAVVAWAVLPGSSTADDNKPASKSPGDKSVTLKGKITCAKCELNDSTKCRTVILVRDPDVKPGENDRDIVYYLDAAADKKHHKQVCDQGVNGTVVGTVTEKNEVKTITVTKLSFKSDGPPK